MSSFNPKLARELDRLEAKLPNNVVSMAKVLNDRLDQKVGSIVRLGIEMNAERQGSLLPDRLSPKELIERFKQQAGYAIKLPSKAELRDMYGPMTQADILSDAKAHAAPKGRLTFDQNKITGMMIEKWARYDAGYLAPVVDITSRKSK